MAPTMTRSAETKAAALAEDAVQDRDGDEDHQRRRHQQGELVAVDQKTRSKTSATTSFPFMAATVSVRRAACLGAQSAAMAESLRGKLLDRGALAVRLLPPQRDPRARAQRGRRHGRGAQPALGDAAWPRPCPPWPRCQARRRPCTWAGRWRRGRSWRSASSTIPPRRDHRCRLARDARPRPAEPVASAPARLRGIRRLVGGAAGRRAERGRLDRRAGRRGGPLHRRRHLVRGAAPQGRRLLAARHDARRPVGELTSPTAPAPGSRAPSRQHQPRRHERPVAREVNAVGLAGDHARDRRSASL